MSAFLKRSLQHVASKLPQTPSQQNTQDSTSWRGLASNLASGAKLAALNAYEGSVVQEKVKLLRKEEGGVWASWRERRKEESKGVEKIHIFPGYAVKRSLFLVDAGDGNKNEFSIDIFVDGYASKVRPPQMATRTQKAFMALARSFAALPSVPPLEGAEPMTYPDISDTASVQDEAIFDEFPELRGRLPPRPSEITDSAETVHLKRDSQALTSDANITRVMSGDSISRMGGEVTSEVNISAKLPRDTLQRLHANLDQRLQPFWCSAISDRTIRISIYVSEHHDQNSAVENAEDDIKPGPIAVKEVRTNDYGYFSQRFDISYNDICSHPSAKAIAMDNPLLEHYLQIKVELVSVELAPPALTRTMSPAMIATPPVTSPPASQSDFSNTALPTSAPTPPPRLPPRPSSSSISIPLAPSVSRAPPPPPRSRFTTSSIVSTSSESFASSNPPAQVQMSLPVTSAKVRLISDIDDTVKRTDVTMSLRVIYRNVFVRDMNELIIPGMPEWYQAMSRRGVRFHYVSNSPFELLGVLTEFIATAGLPVGSLKLKYYGGRSILNGLWTGAAEKKRAGVIGVLDTFTDSRFFLVGDSGEQDMELYTSVAAERPQQILGVFIRDVTTFPDVDQSPMFTAGATTPTGAAFPRSVSEATESTYMAPGSPIVEEPTPVQSMPTDFSKLRLNSSSTMDSQHSIDIPGTFAERGNSTDAARKKEQAFRLRLEAARQVMPDHIPLRIFKNASDCVESFEILDGLGLVERANGAASSPVIHSAVEHQT